jgi:hypothetical protein
MCIAMANEVEPRFVSSESQDAVAAMDPSLNPSLIHAKLDTADSSPTDVPSLRRKRNKRVSFQVEDPDIICIMKPASEMSKEERNETCWQRDDFDRFRRSARYHAHQIQKLSKLNTDDKRCNCNYDVVLSKVYQIYASRSNESENQQLSENFSESKDLRIHPKLFEILTHWNKNGHSRRGLEKLSIPYHNETRNLARNTAVQAVLITQEVLQENRGEAKKDQNSTNFHFDLPDDEILRKVSEKYSKTSKCFAICMGHADAAAVDHYVYEPSSK